MYQIRTLTGADVSHIRKLRLAGLIESPAAFGQTAEEFERMPDEELMSWIGPSSDKFALGAYSDDGNLVGFLGVTRQPRWKVRHKGVIWGVYVLPEFRGQGIATLLLEKAFQQAKSLPDLSLLQLCVATSQLSAVKLYTLFGFEEFGLEPRALRQGDDFVDELHMYRSL